MSQSRDVLAQLLTDPPEDAPTDEAELTRLIYRRRSYAVESGVTHLSNYRHHSEDAKRIEDRKKKVTYYLSEKVVVELSEAKARIKVSVPQQLKTKVSMSRIVDYAVGAILDEFNQIGEKSDLMRRFLTNKKKER